jgi:hypothetical protein
MSMSQNRPAGSEERTRNRSWLGPRAGPRLENEHAAPKRKRRRIGCCRAPRTVAVVKLRLAGLAEVAELLPPPVSRWTASREAARPDFWGAKFGVRRHNAPICSRNGICASPTCLRYLPPYLPSPRFTPALAARRRVESVRRGSKERSQPDDRGSRNVTGSFFTRLEHSCAQPGARAQALLARACVRQRKHRGLALGSRPRRRR